MEPIASPHTLSPSPDAPVREADDSGTPDAEQVLALLGEASALMRSDPSQGRRIAERCVARAEHLGRPELLARASYLCARAYALNGEYAAATAAIARAQAAYHQAGATFEALRTNVGLVSVLREQGAYQQALETARQTLSEAVDPNTGIAAEDATYLAALMQQNTGLCYEQMGQYEAALAAYTESERHFRAVGMHSPLGELGTNRGIVLLNLGRPSEALAAFEQSATQFAQDGLTLLLARTLLNIGNAHLMLGQFAHSLAAFERARRLFESLEARTDVTVLTLDTGDAYMALNSYAEALAAYRKAATALRESGMPHDQARALWGAGTALLAQGQLDAAAAALDEAAALFRAAGNLPLLSSVLLEHASIQARRGETTAARALAARALDLVSGKHWPVQQCYAHLRLADLQANEQHAAEQHLLAARRISEQLGLPQLTFRIYQRLGRLRMLQSRPDEARGLLEAAAELIERQRGTLATESLRVSFIQDKVAVYEDLLRLQLERRPSDPWRALIIAERARARALADRLADPTPPPPPSPGVAAELATLQADLHALYTELLGPGFRPERAAALRQRATELEQAIALLRLRSAAETPPDPLAAPPGADELRLRLDTAGGVLVYQLLGDEIVAFVYAGGELSLVRHVGRLSSVEPLVARLASQWERFNAGPDFVARHMTVLERSAHQVLGELYQRLLAPIASQLARIPGTPRRLTVVPHGLLHQVPFHALTDGERHLVDDYAISYAPSVTAMAPIPGPAARAPRRALIVGVSDPLIPEVASEVAAIASHLPDATLLTGDEATVAAVRAAAPGCAIVHLACHGVFRGDNPLFSSLRLSDGWLSAAEIARLDLRGALITLSACESGRGRVYDGDEVLGLTRAFLGAGARALLVSLWLVQDTTTAALMREWYALIAHGMGHAAALRLAQIALRRQFPHPYYWAPFFLIGER